ncbi:copper chaperone PCu(A)C [Egicoccus halophilus]|uniref:copper chaperone PCu(A)C n=1 Tax=Egicoccus halophilus TaxID=1670830 RepID=UPI0013EE63B3|nr:copper chaperone PCu(A)C [Egicoccus halophilus]
MVRTPPPRLRLAALLGALALSACAGGNGDPELEISPAQAAEPAAGSSQVVVEITNGGTADDTLQRADTDAAAGVEVHLTEVEDGRASMTLQDEVDIPAGETVRFRPGGLHLMLVVPDATVTEGGTFDLTLHFERSGEVTIPVEVVSMLDLAENAFDEDGTTAGTDG